MTCKDCANLERCVSLGYGDTEADSAELCCKGFKQKSVYREPISPDNNSATDGKPKTSSWFHRFMNSWVAAVAIVPVFCAPIVEFVITQTVRFSFIPAVLLLFVGLVGLLSAAVPGAVNGDERAQDFGALLISGLGTLMLGVAFVYMGADIIEIIKNISNLFKGA